LVGEECTAKPECKVARGYKAEDSRYYENLDQYKEMKPVNVYDRTDYDLQSVNFAGDMC